MPLETKFKIGVFRDSVCWYDNSYHFVLIFGASLTNPRCRMRQTTVIHVTFVLVTVISIYAFEEHKQRPFLIL